MTGRPATLDDHYRATTYRVFVPDEQPIDIRIGEASAKLDALLAKHGVEAWAYVTAWNPASRQLEAQANRARQAALSDVVRERGWVHFEGEGIPANSTWQPEASVLVLGIARSDAVALGARFGQRAIVAGERGGAAVLVYCD